MTTTAFVTVAQVSEILPDHGLQVVVHGRSVAVFLHQGEWSAIDDECPHKKTPLSQGNCAYGQVSCPMHGWTFNLRTGACTEAPHKPVVIHEVRTVGNELQIRLNHHP